MAEVKISEYVIETESQRASLDVTNITSWYY